MFLISNHISISLNVYWSCWLSVNVRWEFACPFTSVNNKLYFTVIQRVRTWNNHKHFQHSLILHFLLLFTALFTVFWNMTLSYRFFFPIKRGWLKNGREISSYQSYLWKDLWIFFFWDWDCIVSSPTPTSFPRQLPIKDIKIFLLTKNLVQKND